MSSGSPFRALGLAIATLLVLVTVSCGSAAPSGPSALPSASGVGSSAGRSPSPRASASGLGSSPRSTTAASPGFSLSSATPTPPPSASPSAVSYPTLFPLPADLTRPGDLQELADPQTAHIAEPLRAYPYQLAHCGIFSGIDFDGSFWDPVGGQSGTDTPLTEEQIGELINATTGTIKLIGQNAALFGTKSGLVLGLARHQGKKGFPSCD